MMIISVFGIILIHKSINITSSHLKNTSIYYYTKNWKCPRLKIMDNYYNQLYFHSFIFYHILHTKIIKPTPNTHKTAKVGRTWGRGSDGMNAMIKSYDFLVEIYWVFYMFIYL